MCSEREQDLTERTVSLGIRTTMKLRSDSIPNRLEFVLTCSACRDMGISGDDVHALAFTITNADPGIYDETVSSAPIR